MSGPEVVDWDGVLRVAVAWLRSNAGQAMPHAEPGGEVCPLVCGLGRGLGPWRCPTVEQVVPT